MKRKKNALGSDDRDDSKGEQPSVNAVDSLSVGADMDLEMTRIVSETQEAVEAVRQSFVSASHAREETIAQAQAEADTIRDEADGIRAEAEARLADARTEADKLIADSKNEAEARLADARTEADKLIADSKNEAEARLKEAEKQAAHQLVQAADQAETAGLSDGFSRAMERDSDRD